MKLLLTLLGCLTVAACADGARPRLSAAAPTAASPATGFGGAYAGANGGLADLDAKGAPF